ncbi:MAG: apolipoprotein N-acyltransferase [Thermodesulfobacteriota bacterium]
MQASGASPPWNGRQYAGSQKSIRENLILALISGLLLGFPWIYSSLAFLTFVAWIPLFILEERLRDRPNPYLVFNYALACFLVWNILGTWWVTRAHLLGGMLIILANALCQAFSFWLASRVGAINRMPRLLPFVVIWMGFEYFHEWWDLAWPWLNLGNALAATPEIIQWYEFTGARGGTLWIILANVSGLTLYKSWQDGSVRRRMIAGAACLLIVTLPVFLSWHIYRNVEIGADTLSFALVQPNLDPYTEKFVPEKQAGHMDLFFDTAGQLCDEKTRLLIGPETQIVAQIDEQDPGASLQFRRLKAFQQQYPQLSILLGVHSFERLARDETVPGSRYDVEKNVHYEAFDSALFLPSGSDARFYHKTKLVPLFERMPFVQHLRFLGRFSLELGGYNGTYSNRQAHAAFKDHEKAVSILPIVCFESIFGSYCARRLSEQSGFIGMVTNDGWWKNTPGYKHHFNFSRMRAIECRRDLIRAANNGISAHIDARGRVVARTAWWQAATLKGDVHLRAGRTFFSRYGDFLGRGALFCSVGLSLYAGIRRRFRVKS